MKKINPRQIVANPGVFGAVCALILLAVCILFPEKTPYFFSGIIIAGCFLWAIIRAIMSKH